MSTANEHPENANEQAPNDANPANAIDGGREVSNKILYVSGLPKTINEDMLRELFNVTGQVQTVKILFDKNRPGFNYAFIEYDNTQSAEMAKRTLNGRLINNCEISINWAFQSQSNKSSDCFNLFVGDLSSEVKDENLFNAFSKFPSLVSAHVMWDMQTGRSRGYGFVSFSNQNDAELALNSMAGEWLGGRQIRLNWASHKNNNNQQQQQQLQPRNMSMNMNQNSPHGPIPIGLNPAQTYEFVLHQTPNWHTTVYIGNISHYSTQNDLIPLLSNYGFIVDLNYHQEKGCAFVKYDTHEGAAYAIVHLSGYNFNGRLLKSGWGKDARPPNLQYQNYTVVYGQHN